VKVLPTPLAGLVRLVPVCHRDDRGTFVESWNAERYAAAGIPAAFVQDNLSRSRRGVLRGLHYQDTTAPMGKLVRCTAGAVFDVAVDLRVGSPTFGEWVGADLSVENMRQMWVPEGFAHGFETLSAFADVQYKCTGVYAPDSEGTVAWNDPDVGIKWCTSAPSLSAIARTPGAGSRAPRNPPRRARCGRRWASVSRAAWRGHAPRK